MSSAGDKPLRVIVVGGGLSGLAAAHRFAELGRGGGLPAAPGAAQAGRPVAVTVLEASPRLGGVIATERSGGFLLEAGADAFLTDRPWAADLCRRLGIAGQLIETAPDGRRSFIVRGGRLVPVPSGWYLLAPDRWATLLQSPLLGWRGKLRMALEPLIPPRRDAADESVAEFVRRRFGREALARVGQPMLAGITTADPERLSLRAAMPAFAEMEARHGSVLRALRARAAGGASGPRYHLFASLRGGVQQLIEALAAAAVPDVAIRCRARVAAVTPGSDWTVLLEDGETLRADAVCLAVPAPHAARLLGAADAPLAALLARIPYASVATVQLGFRRRDVAHPLDGFGFVVPEAESLNLIGCTFASRKFEGRAPEDMVLLRAFLGGALHEADAALDDDALISRSRETLGRLLGITAAPQLAAARRFPASMPQYHVGHQEVVRRIEAAAARHRGLGLTGNAYRGVGIPDCIRHAEATAEQLYASCASLECSHAV